MIQDPLLRAALIVSALAGVAVFIGYLVEFCKVLRRRSDTRELEAIYQTKLAAIEAGHRISEAAWEAEREMVWEVLRHRRQGHEQE